MIFMGQRRSEQRKYAITGGLHDVAAIAMDGVDHQLEGWIDNGTCLFRVEVLHQLHRAIDVGEQRGDRLALTVESSWAVCLKDGSRRILMTAAWPSLRQAPSCTGRKI